MLCKLLHTNLKIEQHEPHSERFDHAKGSRKSKDKQTKEKAQNSNIQNNAQKTKHLAPLTTLKQGCTKYE